MGYWYSGKPSGALKLTKKYLKLDVKSVKPAKAVTVHHLVYLNATYTLTRSTAHGCPLPGRIRVRLVREPWKGQAADPSAYKDLALLPGFEDALDTHTYFEKAEAGRPVHWEFKVEGAEATLGTRYAKADPV